VVTHVCATLQRNHGKRHQEARVVLCEDVCGCEILHSSLQQNQAPTVVLVTEHQ
jgi:hypothetical protein